MFIDKKILYLTISLFCLVLLQACGGDSASVPPVKEEAAPPPADSPQTEAAKEMDDPNLISMTLPGGTEIKYAPDSAEGKIVEFMNADEQDMTQGFALGGDAAQTSNIAALLQAFPTSKIRLEGASAEEVSAALTQQGVAADRITAKSKGGEGCSLYFTALY